MKFKVGDIVSRISDDEHIVFGVNPPGDLIGVRCVKPDSGGCFEVDFEEWNIPSRYTLVRSSSDVDNATP